MSDSAATYPVGTIAKLLVLTERQVQSLAVQGVLPKAERGRYELVPVVQAYIRYLRDRSIGGDGGHGDIGALKARMISARARMAEAEADHMDGTLVKLILVEAAWGRIVSNMRARLLAIPTRCAPAAQAATVSEAAAIITAAVDEALEEISRTPIYSVAEPDRSGDAGPGGEADSPSSGAAAKTDGIAVG